MAIIRTKPFFIVATLEKKEKILKKLQILNCMQIEEIENEKKENMINSTKTTEEMEKKAEKAISLILQYSALKEKKQEFKEEKKIKDLMDFEKKIDELNIKAEIIINFNEEIKTLKKEITKIKTKNLILKNYVNLNHPLQREKTKNTSLIFGEIPINQEEDISLKLNKIKDVSSFEVIFKNSKTAIIYLIYLNKFEETVKKTLKKIDFVLTTTESKKIPKEEILENEKKIKEIEDSILDKENLIKENSKNLEELKTLVDFLKIKKEKFETIAKIGVTKNTFLIKGFVNPFYEKKLINIITKDFSSHIEIFKEEENSPVFFLNNFFASPIENITRTYSMPSKNDIDPNPIMSFFYYMFFGMMFSDAGYGALLTTACFFLLVFKKLNYEKKQTLKMFFFCGISTTFWGLMYGSFFGDVILTVSKTFLNKNFNLAPIWINTTQDPLKLLIFSIFIGILQILVGLILKFYILIKQKDKKEAFFNVFNFIVILTGMGFLAINFMLNLELINTIGKILIFAGLTLTLFLSGYKNKGIMKIFGGIINIYGITSYVSDILSYSRLMALGIATGVIANVVNILASMGGNNLIGKTIFIFVFILGHTLNFSINILGAYVHTNRLQYVEFFSKFYTGGGKSFNPFGMHTKYFKFLANKK